MTTESNLRKKALGLGSTATLLGGSAGAMLVGLLAAPAGAVGSTTFVVDTLDDGSAQGSDCTTPVPGSCSLRDALDADSDGDTITFASGLTGTILLNSGELEINSEITISGPGADALTIDADGASRVFYLCAGPLTEIAGVTITGGSASHGGGLYDECSDGFTLRNVVVTGNHATSSDGGALYSGGTVTLIGSTISNNDSIGKGGGVKADGLEMTDSHITGNQTLRAGQGGGGAKVGGDFTMVGGSVEDNTAYSDGGGGGVYASGDISIAGATFDSNSSGNCGGGLYAGTSSGTVTILSSTFSNNDASYCYGGAIDIDGNGSTVVIANTTITGNSAPAGGGVHFDAGNTVSLFQDTITQNDATSTDALYSGGGLHFSESGLSVELSGTIVSDNTAAAGPADIGLGSSGTGSLTITSGFSILGVGAAIDAGITVTGGNNIRSDSPGLEALADNGGPTMTMALMADSVAVDAGPNPVATFTGNAYDQRGTGFPRIVGGMADIGAFEWALPPEPTTTTTIPEPTTTTAGGDPVVPEFTG